MTEDVSRGVEWMTLQGLLATAWRQAGYSATAESLERLIDPSQPRRQGRESEASGRKYFGKALGWRNDAAQ